MKVTTEWLAEFIAIDSSVEQLAERLTMAGLEVEHIQPAVPAICGVVSARITRTSPHPTADRLQLCEVDAGAFGRHLIICGAANARHDLMTILALPGARIADGKEVQKSTIRDVESAGMLCSAAEIGFGDDSMGILELDPATARGVELSTLVPLDDTIIEINVTPNRGDCQSVLGIARELSAIFDRPLSFQRVLSVAAETASTFSASLQAPDKCSCYVGRVIERVDASVATPLWLKERLRRCGVRSINVVVDITNYTMLALGQPMHAFDLKRLNGAIEVRDGRPNERLVLLDGTDLEFGEGSLVIADEKGPLALAGVMGGRASGVETSTTSVFLESAYFDPISLASTARRLNIQTDAAQRFERGVDPDGQARAVEFATRLLLDICGGAPGPTTEISEPGQRVAPRAIEFRLSHAAEVLGMSLDVNNVHRIFERLKCRIAGSLGAPIWSITPPSYRFDLIEEIDLIEEVARIRGYEMLPATRPHARTTLDRRASRVNIAAVMRDYLVADGYFEAITYSFIPSSWTGVFGDPTSRALELANPISQEMAVMRSSLWPGLLLAAQHNLNRQAGSVRLFEVGMVFEAQGNNVSQTVKLAGVAVGQADPKQWGTPPREVDFFDLKRTIDNLLTATRVHNIQFIPHLEAGLHPGQTAAILVNDKHAGMLGLLHPKIRNSLELQENIFLFEISLEALPTPLRTSFAPLSRYPQVRRDISIVVPEAVTADTVLATVRAADDGLLKDLQLFDVYRGQGIDSDKKSLALGLIFQASSSTLTDDRVEITIEKILDRLSRDLGGALRA
ncbi:MAG: phenylalanine--tRNA ligase subunit beta [Gammaproteobacteria bacterium]|nr:phenylalanine--tRNA ligase subunit beta [Gammaproteobacteria bacterium]